MPTTVIFTNELNTKIVLLYINNKKPYTFTIYPKSKIEVIGLFSRPFLIVRKNQKIEYVVENTIDLENFIEYIWTDYSYKRLIHAQLKVDDCIYIVKLNKGLLNDSYLIKEKKFSCLKNKELSL